MAIGKKVIAWIKGKVSLDTKEFKKGAKDVQKQSKGIGSYLKKIQGAIAGSVIAGAVMKIGSALFKVAKDMALIEAKARTVFGSYINQVRAAADETASSMGLTTNEYVKAAAGIQDLLIPMKFTRAEATGMSVDLMKLSGALSQWSGGTYSAVEVGRIFTKAMLGEREELKSLGISITEADVKARLMEKGQQKLTGTMLQQAKAQATMELITEKSTDAQALFAEGQENLVTLTAEAGANYKTAGENLARILNPAFKQGAKGAGELGGALAKVTGRFAEMQEREGYLATMIKTFGGVSLLFKDHADNIEARNAKLQAQLIVDSQMSSAEQILAAQAMGDAVSKEWRILHTEHQKLKKKEAEEAKAAAEAEIQAKREAVRKQIEELNKLKAADNKNLEEMKAAQVAADESRKGMAEGYQIIDTANKKLQETYAGTVMAVNGLNEQFLKVPETTKLAGVSYDELGNVIQERQPQLQRTWEDFSLAEKVVTGVSEAMQMAAISQGASLGDMVKAGANAARQIISQEIAKAVTAAAGKALATVPFPFNIAAAGLAGAAASALFNRIVPSFGEGAMVTGPMLAMVGEKGPELIVPLNKLGDLGGKDGKTILRGEDIWITQDNRNKRNLRTR